MTLRKKIIVALISLSLMVMALRETGFVDLNLYQSNVNTSTNSTINTTSSFVSWGDTKNKTTPVFNPRDLSIIIVDGQDTIYKERNKLQTILVTIQYSQTGSLWIPLYKSVHFSAVGTPSFDPKQKLKDASATSAFKFAISGILEMNGQIVIKGLCSHKEARKLIKKQIVENFATKIKEQFAQT